MVSALKVAQPPMTSLLGEWAVGGGRRRRRHFAIFLGVANAAQVVSWGVSLWVRCLLRRSAGKHAPHSAVPQRQPTPDEHSEIDREQGMARQWIAGLNVGLHRSAEVPSQEDRANNRGARNAVDHRAGSSTNPMGWIAADGKPICILALTTHDS